MARGGKRAGQPGRSYSNRTDLNLVRAPQQGTNTVAAGGVSAPAPQNPSAPPGPPGGGGSGAPPAITPDQVTPMDAPTDRPTEPVTSGLPTGPGPGPTNPAALSNRTDLAAMVQHLPLLVAEASMPGTPPSVIAFVQFLQSMVPTGPQPGPPQ